MPDLTGSKAAQPQGHQGGGGSARLPTKSGKCAESALLLH